MISTRWRGLSDWFRALQIAFQNCFPGIRSADKARDRHSRAADVWIAAKPTRNAKIRLKGGHSRHDFPDRRAHRSSDSGRRATGERDNDDCDDRRGQNDVLERDHAVLVRVQALQARGVMVLQKHGRILSKMNLQSVGGTEAGANGGRFVVFGTRIVTCKYFLNLTMARLRQVCAACRTLCPGRFDGLWPVVFRP